MEILFYIWVIFSCDIKLSTFHYLYVNEKVNASLYFLKKIIFQLRHLS